MFGTVSVYKTTEATATTRSFISWQLISPFKNHPDIFPFASHPLLSVKADIARNDCVNRVITAHFNLKVTTRI
jgi:hypothetical protein